MLFLNTLIRNNDTHLTYSSTAERCYVAKFSFLFSVKKTPTPGDTNNLPEFSTSKQTATPKECQKQ